MDIDYSPNNINFKGGTVIIAGAGPGDLKLLTLKTLIAIKSADILIYDSLVNKEVLNYSKKDSKKIFAGKTKTNKACSQEDINYWLVKFAKMNKRVLRLKGGDISFFSRGSQEIDFLKKYKIKFKIFSGITSAQSATENYFNPQKNFNDCLNLITGHKRLKSMNKDINYKYLVKTNGKTIIYMGVSQINLISNNLIKNGMKKNTKVFIVTNSSRKNQKTYETTLIDTSKYMKKHNVKPPSIIIIN